MVLNSIEKLLEKYDNGETTLKEEQQLKTYFAQDDIAPHLESYKTMFQYFNNTKQELYTKDVPLKTRKSYIYQWISVAAVAVLMLGILIPNIIGGGPSSLEDLSTEQQMAFNQTKEVFDIIGTQFNTGQNQMGALSLTSSNFEKGADQVKYINEFSETSNKFFKSKTTKTSKESNKN
ncbi:MAG: hypothetical protein V7719_04735 [Psychroserpens sp.]|uniref:hypothetical protein n=1 Tax=Psychroserpens sp. TaxID=2020870 RepID=UPI0030031936